MGPSAGARIGLILSAVENRYRAVFLMGAGVTKGDLPTIAEANPINFVPHLRGPKRMLHGRYDADTPLKTQAEPLFKLLRDPKRSVLDETLGPVKHE